MGRQAKKDRGEQEGDEAAHGFSLWFRQGPRKAFAFSWWRPDGFLFSDDGGIEGRPDRL
jgi:hypothetical protein